MSASWGLAIAVGTRLALLNWQRTRFQAENLKAGKEQPADDA